MRCQALGNFLIGNVESKKMSQLKPCLNSGVWYKRAGAERVSLVTSPTTEGGGSLLAVGACENHGN
jgi:hypothetical protein